ncbi:hypothetical protein PG996_009209 [Apiospora saccharicola]|uniref:Uncharacterized protein n=1 Tax=Apiospora saccharicola TaxID=335842 RepID=A0ABR1UK28_9PEZI
MEEKASVMEEKSSVMEKKTIVTNKIKELDMVAINLLTQSPISNALQANIVNTLKQSIGQLKQVLIQQVVVFTQQEKVLEELLAHCNGTEAKLDQRETAITLREQGIAKMQSMLDKLISHLARLTQTTQATENFNIIPQELIELGVRVGMAETANRDATAATKPLHCETMASPETHTAYTKTVSGDVENTRTRRDDLDRNLSSTEQSQDASTGDGEEEK